MTREETKRDLHHLYSHWSERLASSDHHRKAHSFYNWLKAVDTGILSFGNFGPGPIPQHIATWVAEWERKRVAYEVRH
jgi:hypothetical protein